MVFCLVPALFVLHGILSAGKTYAQNCGVQTAPLNPESKIVGGTPAQEGEWPWQAFIQNGDTKYGGILVDPQWVLTWPAQHTSGPTTIYMGSNKLENPSSNLQTRTLLARYNHPNFHGGDDYRVSLIKVNAPFTMTDYVRTVCYPDHMVSFPSGKSCMAAGWGMTSDTDPNFSLELLDVEVKIAQRSYCQTQYPTHTITDSMVCAGGVAGEGICHGDGPLVSKVNSRWYVVGVPSFGNGCAEEGYPAVYTYAPAVHEWIHSLVTGSQSRVRSSMFLTIVSFVICSISTIK